MKKPSTIITIVVTILSIGMVVLLATSLKQDPNAASRTLIGKAATDFDAPNIRSGQPSLKLSSFVGTPVVLNFWASWCVSCRQEAKELERFHQAYGDKVKVLGIAVQDTQEDALKFADVYNKTYTLGIDSSGRINVDYGVVGVPETFFLDEKGVIQQKIVGPVSFDMLVDHFKNALQL